ncbi:hypothetical protein C0989_002983 [Termitomyces sp. Mn162]|nr:hypothetical protein C0989_002983 [Termitomyces sp. Mn162]
MHVGAVNLLPLSDDNPTSMVMWLLCLTLNHQDINNTPEEKRNALLRLLRFPTAYRQNSSTFLTGVPGVAEVVRQPPGPPTDIDRDTILEKATPIIILIFALNEVVPITIPTHVPETRAIAIASQRSGPTAEDLRGISRGRTPLFAETKVTRFTGTNPVAIMSNPIHLELYKSRINDFLFSTYTDPNYKPGPYLPIPSSYSLDLLESAVKSGGFGYGKYAAAADEGISAGRLPSEVIDVIFLGETLPDHEQAFGGFKFSGRIRADGYMIMCREPKNYADREGLGTWIFEGHLRYGVALVGQWRTSISTATYDLRGIFSLHKTSDVR